MDTTTVWTSGPTDPTGPGVVAAVLADGTVDAGIRESVRRDARLLLLVPPGVAHSRVAHALHRSRVQAPGLHVAAVRSPACRTACARPSDLLVVEPADVTADLLGGGAPLLVVPPGAGGTGPVTLGMAPWTGDGVIGTAVREGRERGGLRVLRVWSDPAVDPGLVRTETLDRWTEVDARLQDETRRRLDPWRREGDPEVQVLVVRDSAPDALALFTSGAGLLVVGHRDTGGAATTPLVALARAVPCPLLIVPDRAADVGPAVVATAASAS